MIKNFSFIVLFTILSAISMSFFLGYMKFNLSEFQPHYFKYHSPVGEVNYQKDCMKSSWTNLKDAPKASNHPYTIYNNDMVHYLVSGSDAWIVSSTSVEFYVLNEGINEKFDIGIGKNTSKVFWYGDILVGADSTTFQPAMSKSCDFLGYYLDKSHTYTYKSERTESGKLTGGVELTPDR